MIVSLSTKKKYFIAGGWTPYAGQIKNGATVLSSNAPLAKELMGKKIGQRVHMHIVGTEATIIAIS